MCLYKTMRPSNIVTTHGVRQSIYAKDIIVAYTTFFLSFLYLEPCKSILQSKPFESVAIEPVARSNFNTRTGIIFQSLTCTNNFIWCRPKGNLQSFPFVTTPSIWYVCLPFSHTVFTGALVKHRSGHKSDSNLQKLWWNWYGIQIQVQKWELISK